MMVYGDGGDMVRDVFVGDAATEQLRRRGE